MGHKTTSDVEAPRLLGDSSTPLAVCNSLGVHATLLLQPLLLYDPEDRNYVRDVFLVVPTGEERNTDVGVVRKLDLQHGRIFLG